MISEKKVRIAISIDREFYNSIIGMIDCLNELGCNPSMTFSKLVTIALCEFYKESFKCHDCEIKNLKE